jgi:hypothetical protein
MREDTARGVPGPGAGRTGIEEGTDRTTGPATHCGRAPNRGRRGTSSRLPPRRSPDQAIREGC